MADLTDENADSEQGIIREPFESALSSRYLVYALSTITARSLPALRDGLTPGHRRLLWPIGKKSILPTSVMPR